MGEAHSLIMFFDREQLRDKAVIAYELVSEGECKEILETKKAAIFGRLLY